jgi:hypothetical protein
VLPGLVLGMFMLVVLPPAADAPLTLPIAAVVVELVLLLWANTEPATTTENANAATIATRVIRFKLDMQNLIKIMTIYYYISFKMKYRYVKIQIRLSFFLKVIKYYNNTIE